MAKKRDLEISRPGSSTLPLIGSFCTAYPISKSRKGPAIKNGYGEGSEGSKWKTAAPVQSTAFEQEIKMENAQDKKSKLGYL